MKKEEISKIRKDLREIRNIMMLINVEEIATCDIEEGIKTSKILKKIHETIREINELYFK